MTLVLKSKSEFIGGKCLAYCLKFVTAASKVDSLMTLIKPYAEVVLNEVLIPLMLPTHEEISVFSDDPIEMIRIREYEVSPQVHLM